MQHIEVIPIDAAKSVHVLPATSSTVPVNLCTFGFVAIAVILTPDQADALGAVLVDRAHTARLIEAGKL